MKIQCHVLASLILVMCLVMPGCVPGQFLGPSVTPSSTSTPEPTSTHRPTSTPPPTPTITPLPIGTVLTANGFELNAGQTCPEGPCQVYYNIDLFMVATFFDSGRFVLERYLVNADVNLEQGPVYLEIFESIYPQDIADAILGRDTSSGNMVAVPYSGEIDGYQYEAFLAYSDRLDCEEMVVSVVPLTSLSKTPAQAPTPSSSPTQASSAQQSIASFIVDARQQAWFDTGILVQKSDEIFIEASGTIDFGGVQSGPDGSPDIEPGYGVVPTAPYGALVGMIGSGDPFLVGSQYQGKAQSSGNLLLLINDVAEQYIDNSGQFQVTITIIKK
jgi:hypothetical protein